MKLFISTLKDSPGADGNCSGCDKQFGEKEEFVNGIESCCGQCYRQLCFECIDNIILLRKTADAPSDTPN